MLAQDNPARAKTCKIRIVRGREGERERGREGERERGRAGERERGREGERERGGERPVCMYVCK